MYLLNVVFAVLRENESARERKRESAHARERESGEKESEERARDRERVKFVLHSKNESLRTMQESSAGWRNPDVC